MRHHQLQTLTETHGLWTNLLQNLHDSEIWIWLNGQQPRSHTMTMGDIHPPDRPIAIAPAPVRSTSESENTSNKADSMPYTCQTCTRRKVKCDKLTPICSTCSKAKLECTYQAPPPRKRKRKLSGDINERLAYYERILQQHGLLTESPSDNSPVIAEKSKPVQQSAQDQEPKRVGRLLSGHGTTR